MATVIKGGLLIDGSGRAPLPGHTVVFDDGVIAKVAPDAAITPAPGDTVVEAKGRTIMPGLIDCHTHLAYHTRQPNVWVQELKESIELNTLHASVNCRSVLHAGFTAIGDGGCRGFITSALRDAVENGTIVGPRIRAAGAIICGEAGLLDTAPPWSEVRTHAGLGMMVTGVDEIRKAVRRQVKGGVDWIKVAASGVAGSQWSSAETDDLSFEELHAAVVEAAKFGLPAHAHAHSVGGIKAAVKAGVISIHSAEFADDEAVADMRAKGVYFSPTIAWLHARCMPQYGAPTDPEFRKEAWDAYAAARHMMSSRKDIADILALGSDAAHRFPHVPDGVIELEYFVALGLTPMQAIVAATRNAAAAIGMGDRIGQVKPGLAADLLLVEGNPAENISVLRDKRNIARLWKGGAEVALPPDRGRIGVDFEPAKWLWHDLEQLSAA